MLLNLSNHPTQRWTDLQRHTAQQHYGTTEDLPFPRIPPEATEAELNRLVDDYFQRIRERNPSAVHLMGEMTFTYRLVHRLKTELGLPVVASTTERTVEERDGKKIVQFQFVQFRSY